MPIKHAAVKHLRQAKKKALKNKAEKTSIKEQVVIIRKALAAKDYAKAEAALKKAIVIVDKARAHGVLSRNAAARKKSRLFAGLKKAKPTA